MGAASSIELFGLDELILFAFYHANRGRYRRVAGLGANIGLHSLILDRCGYDVRSFEPDPLPFERLTQNLVANDASHVTPENAAVSVEDGELEFVRVLGSTTGSHLAGAKANPYGRLERFTVRVVGIAPVLDWADLLKIDIEGHERELLLATRGDQWAHTDALVEVGTPESAAAIFDHFAREGVGLFAQKIGWRHVERAADMPARYRDGTLFISRGAGVPWGDAPGGRARVAWSPPRAIVLSAGYGTRLGGLTTDTPKPMLDVGGRPLLERIVRHLAAQGVREVGIDLHFLPERIRAHLGDGAALGVRIRYSEEPALLGTAGGVRRFGAWLREGGDTFIVQYGDVLTDQSLAPLLARHRECGALVTILVHRRARSNSIVEMDEHHRVTRFVERPVDAASGAAEGWVNSGLYVCDLAVIDRIPESPADFPRDVFPALVAEGRVCAVPLSSYRCAVDSPERLEEARAAVREGRLAPQGGPQEEQPT